MTTSHEETGTLGFVMITTTELLEDPDLLDHRLSTHVRTGVRRVHGLWYEQHAVVTLRRDGSLRDGNSVVWWSKGRLCGVSGEIETVRVPWSSRGPLTL